MCGIAGFVGDFDPAQLPAMATALAHRGPDDRGQFWDPKARVGLVHTRLSILDTSSEGHQPMTVAGTGVWLTYNGELFNFPTLRKQMRARGVVLRSRCDAEVLVHLYLQHGDRMFEHLDGMYAFAIWDSAKRSLLLARDGLGVKPLYLAHTPGGIAFASELKALLQLAEVPRTPDRRAIHQYLAYLWAPAPRTMLEHIKKVPLGTAITVSEGQIVRRFRHYQIPFDGSRRRGSRRALAEELRHTVTDAVHRQLLSDVPVGAFLSGGLDSSSIVAMATSRQDPSQFPCYAIGFSGRDLDGAPADLPYARLAARHLRVPLHEINVQTNIIQHLRRMLWHADEPQADPAGILTMLIAHAARQDGVKVLLSGTGGDDVFSGYRRHQALCMTNWLDGVPRPARRALAQVSERLVGRGTLGRRLAKLIRYADGDPTDRILGHFLWSPEELRRNLYQHDFAAELDGFDTQGPLRASLEQIPDEPDPLNRMLYLECQHFLADHNLLYTDKASMARGIEVRVPLIDRAVVDLCAHLPPEEKCRRGQAKALFRQAVTPLLPPAILYRPKTGFGLPLRRWIHRELADTLRIHLSPEALVRRGWFDPTAVWDLIERDRAHRVDASYLIFSLLCLELWAQLFLDRTTPPQFPPLVIDRVLHRPH